MLIRCFLILAMGLGAGTLVGCDNGGGDGDADADSDGDVEPTCGDDSCDEGEDAESCPDDCDAECGDGACTHAEDATSCEDDCPAVCDDGECTHDESAATCEADCPADCGDSACTHTEDATTCEDDCPAVCGDDACTHDEDATTCEADCPSRCGDETCTHDETAGTCPGDCDAVCGDGLCTHAEDAASCAADCPADCGDDICSAEENPGNCEADCPAVCGDGHCSHDENAEICSADCPADCGDERCTHDEDAESCEDDCPAVCGDDACTHAEDAESCEDDCPADCGDDACTHAEDAGGCPADCPADCGDDACTHAENARTCGADCPADCGDGFCTHDEDAASCLADCPADCGDDICSDDEDAGSCEADCPVECGDGLCTHDETAATCADDCPADCGDSFCTHDETARSCADDCPAVCDDGFCTHDEDAGGCPADCPAVCGDGSCTHAETYRTCDDDCLAPPCAVAGVTYSGGFAWFKGDLNCSCAETCASAGREFDADGSVGWGLDADNCEVLADFFDPLATFADVGTCSPAGGCHLWTSPNRVEACDNHSGADHSTAADQLYCSCEGEDSACSPIGGPVYEAGFLWYKGGTGCSCEAVCGAVDRTYVAAGSGEWALDVDNCEALAARFDPDLEVRDEGECSPSVGCHVWVDEGRVDACDNFEGAGVSSDEDELYCSCSADEDECVPAEGPVNVGGFTWYKGQQDCSCQQVCEAVGTQYIPAGTGAWALDADNCTDIAEAMDPELEVNDEADCSPAGGCHVWTAMGRVDACDNFAGRDHSTAVDQLYCSCAPAAAECTPAQGPVYENGLAWFKGNRGCSCAEVCDSVGAEYAPEGSGTWALVAENCETLAARFDPDLEVNDEGVCSPAAGCHVWVAEGRVDACDNFGGADLSTAADELYCSCR